jgi:quercetin dioxygenase-like cupin family protein
MTKIAGSLLLLAVSAAWAQTPGAVIKHVGELDWKVSGTLPPGAEFHLIYEDPKTGGVHTLVHFPAGYTLPSHSITHDETIVIIKGKLIVGLGDTMTTLEAGSYAMFPAGVMHSLKAKGNCIFLMATNGPFDIKGLPSVK